MTWGLQYHLNIVAPCLRLRSFYGASSGAMRSGLEFVRLYSSAVLVLTFLVDFHYTSVIINREGHGVPFFFLRIIYHLQPIPFLEQVVDLTGNGPLDFNSSSPLDPFPKEVVGLLDPELWPAGAQILCSTLGGTADFLLASTPLSLGDPSPWPLLTLEWQLNRSYEENSHR